MPARLTSRHALGRVLSIIALVAVLAACSTDDGQPAADVSDDVEVGLAVAIASFDLAVGEDRRLLAGLFTDDAQMLTFGDVRFELGHLGDETGGAAEISQEATASFLAVPGWEPEGSREQPTLDPVDGRGLYAAEVDLDAPGNWGLRVIADLDDGRRVEGHTVFTVAEQTQVPDVGDPAPRTVNHTVEDVDEGLVTPVALDSRAQDGSTIPDQHLHDTRITDAIDAGRPVVVIVSTPVYCRTNFCGPLVETLSETAGEYDDRAAFVHLEIYEDFDEQQLNEAAASWIQPADGSEGGEPWVFLVDADGTIAARWDNVLDLGELLTFLDELPVTDGGAEGDA